MPDPSDARQRRINDYLRNFERLDTEEKQKHHSLVLVELIIFLRGLAGGSATQQCFK